MHAYRHRENNSPLPVHALKKKKCYNIYKVFRTLKQIIFIRDPEAKNASAQENKATTQGMQCNTYCCCLQCTQSQEASTCKLSSLSCNNHSQTGTRHVTHPIRYKQNVNTPAFSSNHKIFQPILCISKWVTSSHLTQTCFCCLFSLWSPVAMQQHYFFTISVSWEMTLKRSTSMSCAFWLCVMKSAM